MNPWFAKALLLVSIVLMTIIRSPHARRNKKIPVASSRRGQRENVLVNLTWLGLILSLVWVFSPLLSFAEHLLQPSRFAAGAILLAAGLWLLHRAHADLGPNWSISLELRTDHRLVTTGVYHRIRHPMYAALFLIALAQALFIPNWVAGFANLAIITCIFFLRLKNEERMMEERFGEPYRTYAMRTRRLIPGVW